MKETPRLGRRTTYICLESLPATWDGVSSWKLIRPGWVCLDILAWLPRVADWGRRELVQDQEGDTLIQVLPLTNYRTLGNLLNHLGFLHLYSIKWE